MLVTKKTHRQLYVQNTIFVVLLLAIVGVVAFLSTRYSFDTDWTATGRNTLAQASTALLNQLDSPILITSFATEDETIRGAIKKLVARYQRQKSDISLTFVNPDLEPGKIRELGISVNGELVIEYEGQTENLKNVSEMGITNALQRLSRDGERWLVFLSGHGERKPHGPANHDLGNWVNQLELKGFKAQSHTLTKQPQIPDNTRVLVIAGPQVNLLPGEVELLKQYVGNGGNLLWMTDPGNQKGLLPLAKMLGLNLENGMIVDPSTQLLGLKDPRFALVADYPGHEINQNIEAMTLFPQAIGLKLIPPEGWVSHNILLTGNRSWSETGVISGSINYNANEDIAGPLTIGVAMSRKTKVNSNQKTGQSEQRIVITGDGDFLSNAYLGNGANMALGMNIINWLAHDDRYIEIPLKMTTDRQLELTPIAQGLIGIGFLFIAPLLFAGSGLIIWWRRRKR